MSFKSKIWFSASPSIASNRKSNAESYWISDEIANEESYQSPNEESYQTPNEIANEESVQTPNTKSNIWAHSKSY